MVPLHSPANLLAIGLIVAVAALAPSTAVAAYPGGNGVIAYSSVDFGPTSGPPPLECFGNAHAGLFTIRPDGSGVRQLTSSDADTYSAPSWSADGRRLVFARVLGGLCPGRKPSWDLSTIGGDGGPVTRIHGPTPEPVSGPSFSPDGRRVVYVEGRIFTIRTDGDARPKKVFDWGAEPEYSPNGSRFVFRGEHPDDERRLGSSIWSIRRDGSHLRRLTKPNRTVPPAGTFPADDTGPTFSPDGKHIAFLRREQATYEGFDGFGDTAVHVMRADGSGEHPVPNIDRAQELAYAPAGDRIALLIRSEDDPYCRDIYTISPTGSDRQRVTEDCATGLALGGWQPDPPSTFVFGKVKTNKRKGTAKVAVTVPGPGDVELARTGKVKRASERAEAQGKVTLPVKLRRKARKRLRRDGRATVRADVTYTPDGGPPNTLAKRVKLVKRAR